MTLKIMIVNTPDNPTDRIIEVERLGVFPGKRNLFAGMSMDGLVFEGSEYHIREAAILVPAAGGPAHGAASGCVGVTNPEPPEETKPQEG